MLLSDKIPGLRACLAASILMLSSLHAAQPPVVSSSNPNIILIFADDLGYGDLSCYGATKIQTPNIDALAAEGKTFTDAHSSSAVCTPSRYGLLTGQYPFRANGGKGVWKPTGLDTALIINTETLTLADVLNRQGYATAAFGKWHLGFKTGKNDWQEPLRPGPQDLGFDYYFGMPVVNSAPPYAYVENDHFYGSDPNDPLINVGRAGTGSHPLSKLPKEAGHRTPNFYKGQTKAYELFDDYEVGTKLTEKAVDWMESRDQGKPFFVYFAATQVHHPFTPAKRFQGTSQAGLYGDFAHELDWIVGELRSSLEKMGVADNTLIIFTSDNGGMFNTGGIAAAKLGHKINGDLLGSKFGVWEGGHRVPFIAWWPGQIEAGTTSDQMLSNVDLLATFAAVGGSELSEAEQQDSINMLPALTGNPDKPLRTEMIVTPNKPSNMALRRGQWMYIPAKGDGGFAGNVAATKLVNTPNSDIENGKIKKDAPRAQLYDLEADVNQTQNVFNQNPEVAQQMAADLKGYRATASIDNAKSKSKKKFK
ncbi:MULTISPECIES: arylsulfatase [unclassified Lentimonas]|uniref:sulfatase family protein n=1 Tax=unclassified Lentimonas TaxID=2630993 RepID=UPI00132A2853|nr:Unannotated [Lentimonas sp. CC19]CAA6694496.1 Unannotated [Lentimonas sp. CC10]CAA7070622.1 Unannotated [Lentimonas sp. CC11]